MSREYVDVELAKSLRAKGHTMKFIADYMGISRRVLYTLRKRGEIEFEEKRVYVGRQRAKHIKSKMKKAAKSLGFYSIHEMMRHYRMVEKKTYREITEITGMSFGSVFYWTPEEIKGIFNISKDGKKKKLEGLKKVREKLRLMIFNGQHIWQRHNKTSMREVSINNFNKAKAHLTQHAPDAGAVCGK